MARGGGRTGSWLRGCACAAGLALGAGPAAAQQPAQEPWLPMTDETVAIIRAEIAELEVQRRILEDRIANAAHRMERAVADAEVAEAQLAELLETADGGLATVERLRAEEAEARAARDAATAELDALRAEIDRGRTQADAAAAETLAGLEARITAAETTLADLEAQVAERTETLAALESAIAAARTPPAAAGGAEVTLQEEQAEAMQAELDRLAEEIAARQVALRTLDAQAGEAEPVADAAVAPAVDPVAVGAATFEVAYGPPRQTEPVVDALDDAPGLAAASDETRAALGDALTAGACVPDALRAAFGSVNRQTAAALVRRLGSGC